MMLLTLFLGFAALSLNIACEVPRGISNRSEDGGLDLATMQGVPSVDLFNVGNPIVLAIGACTGGLETPVSMRNLLVLEAAQFSVSSMFRPAPALDIFGEGNRRRCAPHEADKDLFDLHLRVAIVYLAAHVAIQAMPYCTELPALMEQLGHPLSLLEGDQSTDTPWGLAKAYVDEINAFLTANDGWNADGSMGGRVANRVPFSDFSMTDSEGNEWKGYTPQNTPYEFSSTERWQPLLESNGFGHVAASEHVTPHIGMTARFFGFVTAEEEDAFASRKVDSPSYRNSYKSASRDVLEESRLTATDPLKQFAISLFDNKFTALIPLKLAYFLDRKDTLSVTDFFVITIKVQLAIYNSVVLSWREKIRHDAPRPPSVIKRKLGDELVETYAGPGQGVATIKAEEWQPFIRTMPHSEYPSASSCICEAFAQQLRLWLDGEDEIDPPIQFPPPEFGGPIVTFSRWSEISGMCGDSRVWAGLHFEGAIPAGVELCGGGMAESISASIDALLAGDASAAVFKKDIGELMVRPL